jgi:hypothetical protein
MSVNPSGRAPANVPNTEFTCSICFDGMNSKVEENSKAKVEENQITVLACAHLFHTECIDRWFSQNHNTCPLCRRVNVYPPEAPEAPAPSASPYYSRTNGTASYFDDYSFDQAPEPQQQSVSTPSRRTTSRRTINATRDIITYLHNSGFSSVPTGGHRQRSLNPNTLRPVAAPARGATREASIQEQMMRAAREQNGQ